MGDFAPLSFFSCEPNKQDALSILFSQTRTFWASWSRLMFLNSPTLFPWSCHGLCKQGKEEVITFVPRKIWMQKLSAHLWRSCLNPRLIPMCSLKSAQLGRRVKWCSPRAVNGQDYDISWNKHHWDTRHFNSSTCSSIVINCPRHRKSAFKDWHVPVTSVTHKPRWGQQVCSPGGKAGLRFPVKSMLHPRNESCSVRFPS